MTLKEEYNKICFSIQQKELELENYRTDIFTLNPIIQALTEEISQLYKEKFSLKEKMEKENAR